jgi:negative regulator of sigma E activity
VTGKPEESDAVWSALLDGEERSDLRFLLGRAEREPDVQQRWSRWALAGDLLARRPVAIAPADFADRVAAAIRAEGRPAAVRPHASWLRVTGGLAVAASVAWVALTFVAAPQEPVADVPVSLADTPLVAPPSRAPVLGPVSVNSLGVQQVAVGGLAQPVNFVPFQGEDAYWIRHGLGAQVAPLGSLGTLAWLPREASPAQAEAAQEGR